LAFMSDRGLTGYDNSDVVSGVADEEVYLFDGVTGGLVCASCNPTGERPAGIFDPEFKRELDAAPLLVDEWGAWGGHWLAGSVPGWTPDEHQAALYQSRYLSDDGRLFFDSPDELVPADVDGKENVYEWEPVGVGGCVPGVAGVSVVYVGQVGGGGCVGLISAGTSSLESEFLDASGTGGRDAEGGEGGGEVFFLTASQLVPADEDSAFDVYDAHECSAGSPCLTQAAPAVPPACNNEASCKPAPEAQPSIYGAPASGTSLGGLGNFTPAASVPSQAPAIIKPKPKTVKCKSGYVKKGTKCVKKGKAKKAKKTNRR
jgi:hypothetical protein